MEKEFKFSANELGKEVSLEKVASKYYADIPFHNFDDIKDVLKYAEDAMEQYEKEGISIKKEVVRMALLFHDAGYYENHKDRGFATKEEYSASIAENELKKAGYSAEFIDEVKATIMTTIKDGKFTTNEQKLARMSDISNMAGEYEKFLEYNIRFKNELKYMDNKKFSWNEWKKATKDTMEFYMSQDEDMTVTKKRDENGKTSFYNGLRKNLEKFLNEDENSFERAQEKFEKNFYSKNKTFGFATREAA